MQKLRHIAIATNDPKATAEFYKKAFGFEQVGETSPSSPLATGYFLSDGTLNIAVLKFKTDQLGKGMEFTGVHHSVFWSTMPKRPPSGWNRLEPSASWERTRATARVSSRSSSAVPTARCSISPSIRGPAASRMTLDVFRLNPP